MNVFSVSLVYPNNCSISLAAMGDDYEYQSNVGFWEDIEG